MEMVNPGRLCSWKHSSCRARCRGKQDTFQKPFREASRFRERIMDPAISVSNVFKSLSVASTLLQERQQQVKGELTKMSNPIEVIVGVTPEMIHNWGWFMAFGILTLLLGIAAVIRSVSATVVSMMFFGWLLIFAGASELITAFMVGKWAGFFLHLLAAILFGITGILMVSRPVISAESLTLLMSAFFLFGGVYQFIAAVWTHLPGWGWHAFGGVLASIMGVLIMTQWPFSGLWVIGLFVGIDLIIYGWDWIALALDLKKL
jgi:uncharacterized membrane protein HdeD (DUF308 family)